MRTILPVVQTDNLVFGQGQKAVQRPDRAQPGQRAGAEPGQRPDMTVGQSTGRASPDHSQSVGGAGGGPEELSCLAGLPGVEKRLEFTGYNPVVLTAPAQERQGAGIDVEQRVQPGLGDTGSNIESQVDLTLSGRPVDNTPLRRGTRIRMQPDKYQAGQ